MLHLSTVFFSRMMVIVTTVSLDPMNRILQRVHFLFVVSTQESLHVRKVPHSTVP